MEVKHHARTFGNHDAHDDAECIRERSLESLCQHQKLCQKTGQNDKEIKSAFARWSLGDALCHLPGVGRLSYSLTIQPLYAAP